MSSITLKSRPAFARHIPNNNSKAIVSTYLLDQQSNTRSGQYNIIEFIDSAIHVVSEITASAGVFRFEFRNPSTLVGALTNGSVDIQHFEDPRRKESIPVCDNMLLDIGLSESSLIITTDTHGMAYIVDQNTAMVVSSWRAHSLPYSDNSCEVWSCTMNRQNPDLVATGSEDASMKLWDARTKTLISKCSLFQAGVVFVDFHEDDNIIITGSYDDHLRFIDRRMMKSELKDVKLNGGVWNVETNKLNSEIQYVCACMYGGYSVLDADLNIIRQNSSAGEQLLYGATAINNQVLYCTFNDFLVVID